MQYTIYKVTNLVNGKYYIGKHQTHDPHDGYMGSGIRIKSALKKYGVHNFVKEVLFVFNSEDEMNAKEAELVTEEFVKRDDNYNLCPGGHGGFGYINEHGLNTKGVENRDYQAIARKAVQTRLERNYTVSAETRQKISANNKRTNKSRGQKTSAALKGRPKTEEHKRKIAESLRKRKQTL